MLVRDGFRGRIVCSGPTAELAEIMLLDAAHVQETDALLQTRKNRRRAGREVKPLYTREDAEASLAYFHPVAEDEFITVDEGIRARLRSAGHILGASILELWIKDAEREIKIVFSGDLGMDHQLIVKAPQEIFNADYVFIESTYGNRNHKDFASSKEELLEAINHAVSNREKVLIPAFAIERTQEIIYMLGEFQREGRLPEVPIYLDSPLAIKATEIFRRNRDHYDEEATALVNRGIDPFEVRNLVYTTTTAESMAINERPGPAIVIAGSGMCNAGRIRHHLKHNLWREGVSLVIVGFQAQGSPGRQIVDGKKTVRLFGEEVAVRARVFTIGGFSAHADQSGLLSWVGGFVESSPQVFVVHGENSASHEFAALVHERLGFRSYVPGWREALFLKPREFPIEVAAPAVEEVDLGQDMLQVYQQVSRELERLQERIRQADGRVRITEEDIDRLKYIQEELQQILAA